MAQRAFRLISSITLAVALGALIAPVGAKVKPPEYADKNTMVFECAEVSDMRVPGNVRLVRLLLNADEVQLPGASSVSFRTQF